MYEIQKGLDDRWRVYALPTTCKCCGNKPNYMTRVSPEDGFPTEALAKAYQETL